MMRVLITLLLLLLLSVHAQAGNMDWVFPHIPDDCRLVAGCDPALFATEGLDRWLARVFPAAHADFSAQKEMLSQATGFILAVPAGEGTGSVLFLGQKTMNPAALNALNKGLRAGENLVAVGSGILKGPAELIKQFHAHRSGSLFAPVYARFKSPLFWLSAPITPALRTTIAASPSAVNTTGLTPWLQRLQRVDAVVHKPDAAIHLTINLTLDPPADKSFDDPLQKWLKSCQSWPVHPNRIRINLPAFCPGTSLSIKAQRHASGLIVDVSPFPDVLLELYLHSFHYDGTLELADRFALAALCQLVMRFDGAARIYYAADQEVRKFYDQKLKTVQATENSATTRGNRQQAATARREAGQLLTRKNRQLASLADLCLLNIYLGGKGEIVDRTLRLAGKNAKVMYPHTCRLVEQARRNTHEHEVHEKEQGK